MAKASLSISIYGDYNGKAMAKCEADLRRMAVTAARQSEGIGNSFVSAGDKLTALGNNMQYTGEKIEAAGMKLTKMTAPIAAVGAAEHAAPRLAFVFDDLKHSALTKSTSRPRS